LEDWEGKNDEMSREMWEEMEDKADKARMAEAEGERLKERESAERKEERI